MCDDGACRCLSEVTVSCDGETDRVKCTDCGLIREVQCISKEINKKISELENEYKS